MDELERAEPKKASKRLSDLAVRRAANQGSTPATVFLPYLAGERTPHMDPYARGAWLGLSLAHGRAHLVRALLEGVAFGLRDGLADARARRLARGPRAVGGGTRSRLWREIMAASLDVRLQRLAAEEGPAMGAALLALVGAGVYADVEVAVAAAVHPQGEVEAPDPDLARRYAALHERFRRLYPALKQAKLF